VIAAKYKDADCEDEIRQMYFKEIDGFYDKIFPAPLAHII